MRNLIIVIPKKKFNTDVFVRLLLKIAVIYFILSCFISTDLILLVSNFSPKNPIQNVPIIYQNPTLPTGCEAAAAAMLLQWAGFNVTMENIADALPKGKLPYKSGNKLMGGNPDYEFVGSPYKKSGFGVFHKPIANAIEKYSPCEDLTGCSFEELLMLIDNNRPIIVWATINMKKPSINSTWYDERGNKVVWKVPEHAVVLIGYTDTHVIVNDSLAGGNVKYNRIDFIRNWEYMGKQAVALLEE
ncbi:MAG: hypothetical protein CVU84_09905 [Firmicutes bacterium HGW-Firmicutes-1]|jgi:uncharacterized protein YvpB|nr:MAG: hypothetical protein CVU84_09905 [Firmicutes bacterium HGW-Firmicutes-1]